MNARSPAHTAFGAAIRALRKQHGISQEAFGPLCGLDRSYYGGIERGERNPSLTNILKIANALQTTPAEIFTHAQRLDKHAFAKTRPPHHPKTEITAR